MGGYIVIAVFVVLLLLGLSQWAKIVRVRGLQDPGST